MPYQELAFNGDTCIEYEFIRLKHRFKINQAIELGTCLGSTAIWLGEKFEQVLTIEINPEYFAIAKERVESTRLFNIVLLKGDTVSTLPLVIHGISSNSIWFIDSHWQENCPLQKELEIIAQAKLRPVIAIHDFVVPGNPHLGFDSYNGQPFTFEWLKPSFDKIYGEDCYEYYYNRCIVEKSAKRGIIYLIPKNK